MAEARQVPFRGGGFRPVQKRGVGLVVFVLLIAVVEWGTRAGWISSLTLKIIMLWCLAMRYLA